MTGLETEYQLRIAAEQALSKNLVNLFTPAEQQTLKSFLKMYKDPDILSFQVKEILTPWFDIESQYSKLILNENVKAFVNGRKSTIDLLNLQLSKSKQLTLVDFSQNVYTNLANQVFTASARTMDRVRKNIMDNIAKSYELGVGAKDAGRRLQKQFTQLNTYEANRIARTEINSAQNYGNYQTYYDYNISYNQWWTGQDARVRDSHKALQGEITRVGSKFSNTLLHPGDRSGPIKEWIHCRCTTVPYLMPLGYMAPMGVSTFKEADIVPIPNFKIPTKLL